MIRGRAGTHTRDGGFQSPDSRCLLCRGPAGGVDQVRLTTTTREGLTLGFLSRELCVSSLERAGCYSLQRWGIRFKNSSVLGLTEIRKDLIVS